MNKAGKIISVDPPRAIPGGEVSIECADFQIGGYDDHGCFFDGQKARVVAASSSRILAIVPETFDTSNVEIYLESGGDRSAPFNITVGKKLAEDLHIVANPAIDPKDDSIIVTRSGSRGQKLPTTLYRLEPDGFLNEFTADILNPTGIAFNATGELFVTNRADGEVCRIVNDDDVVPFSSELGIATGIAFDSEGRMYVGDRSGTIFRIDDFGAPETFSVVEPSVSAFHLAFGADGRLYVTAPKLSGFDAVYAIDVNGTEQIFYRGFGRPQGLAFDRDGNLFCAACFRGKHGIVKITPDGETAEMFLAGMNVVGLCFTRNGEMIVATNEEVFSLPLGIYGTLLD